MAGLEDYIAPGVGEAIGLGLDLATADWRNKQQLSQQQKMQDMQIQGQKEMTDYSAAVNQKLAMDMWNNTNYEAQRKHMEDAGLSVGLMYKGAGTGGATASASTGSVTGGVAQRPDVGMGMQLGLQAVQAKANIKLTEAQTANVEADTQKKLGVDTQEAQTRIGAITQGTQNAAVQHQILQYERDIAQAEANVANQTQDQLINNIKIANDKLLGEAEKAKNEGKLSTETYNQLVKQAEQNTVEQQLRMGLIKADIIKTGQQTETYKKMVDEMTAEIYQLQHNRAIDWAKWTQAERERYVKEKLAGISGTQVDFNTSDAAKVKQVTDIFTSILGTIGGFMQK